MIIKTVHIEKTKCYKQIVHCPCIGANMSQTVQYLTEWTVIKDNKFTHCLQDVHTSKQTND